jgi:hypothetical protein
MRLSVALLQPPFHAAFTNPSSVARTVHPLPASRPTYWWVNEVTRLINKPGTRPGCQEWSQLYAQPHCCLEQRVLTSEGKGL